MTKFLILHGPYQTSTFLNILECTTSFIRIAEIISLILFLGYCLVSYKAIQNIPLPKNISAIRTTIKI